MDDWWIGWAEEIPGANAREKTKEKLLISLREAAKDMMRLKKQKKAILMMPLTLPEPLIENHNRRNKITDLAHSE